jgi:7,8-dihydropterin-6-yl-methyl-4-(beta-D-ribofuranosyl)aminobenzene 5'-phosphate synthase
MAEIVLRQADAVSVTVLTDNSLDLFLMQDRGVMHRQGVWPMTPLAEHGLSVCIEVRAGTQEHVVLLDASMTAKALLHNFEVFGLDGNRIESVILSHGHIDHTGGLMGFLNAYPRQRDLVVHPQAFSLRRLNIPGRGPGEPMSALDEQALRAGGVTVRQSRLAATWHSDLVLTLGEIERVTAFEKGFPWAEIEGDGVWSSDSFADDQAVVLRVADGLVVISGCAHAGIVNTVKYAQKVTGIDKVHAVLGGFHLTGPLFEPIIGDTVAAIKDIGPDWIVPMHCTGWKAIHAFAEAMGERFLLNSVGTRYVFA